MIEFLLGLAVGSAGRNSAPISRKAVGIAALVVVALTGCAYLSLPLLFPEQAPAAVEQCSGTAFEAMACGLKSAATTIGIVLLAFVAIVVGVVALLGAAKGASSEG